MSVKLSEKELEYWNILAHACRTNVSVFKYMVQTTDPRILNAVVYDVNLFIVGTQSQPESVKIMLESMSITDFTICYATTSNINGLHIACSNSYSLQTIKYLLESPRFTEQSVNLVNTSGCSPIHYAYIYQPNSIGYFHDSGKLKYNYLDAEYHIRKYREFISETEMKKVIVQKLNDELSNIENEIKKCSKELDALTKMF